MGIPPPSERGVTRHQLLARGATLLSPLAAFACTSEAAEREKIKATAYAQSTAQADPGRSRPTEPPPPTQPPVVQRPSTPAPTAAPTERSRSPEEQAKESTLRLWFQMLSNPMAGTQLQNDLRASQVTIVDKEAWERRLPDIARSTTPYQPPSPLVVKFRFVWHSDLKFSSLDARKYRGELHIARLQLQYNPSPVSDVDKLNGITSQGTVALSFARRISAAYELAEYRTYQKTEMRQQIVDWINTQEPLEALKFTDYEGENWPIVLRRKNERWEMQGSPYGWPIPPSVVFNPTLTQGASGFYCGTGSPSCRFTYMNDILARQS